MAKLSITYIGQATTLIQLSGQSFLSDPNFSKKVLFNKQPEALVAPESLPALSGILISDARYRHLDFFSFKFFKSQIPVFCPEGLGSIVRKFLPNPVTEVPRWSFHREAGLELHAVPVKYMGFRLVPIRHRAATGWVLKSPDASVFFCAGTGYSEHFSEIASLFDLDAAILPVGLPKATWPRKGNQMNAEEVLRAFRDLRAKRLIPIPDSTAVLPGNEDSFFDPLRDKAKEMNLSGQIHFLRSGQSIQVE